MDEAAFRARWAALDTLPCPFAKALLGGFAACCRERRIHLGERVGVNCDAPESRERCARFLEALQAEAGDALRTRLGETLSHIQALKLQVGGLRGLRTRHGDLHEEAVEDVDAQLALATRILPPEALPDAVLVSAVADCEVRPRRRG